MSTETERSTIPTHEAHGAGVITRRHLLGAAGLFGLAGVANGLLAGESGAATKKVTAKKTTTKSTVKTATTAAPKCSTVIPAETAGPYPGDGSNGPNYLNQSGAVRTDIRTSLGSKTLAAGVPLTVKLQLVKAANGCKPIAGGAVYLWHADTVGRYSMYSQGVTNETYLRGVQAADANGLVTFLTSFPGCYDGRWPHIHFEVYSNLSGATSRSGLLRTSQLALPADTCKLVYATPGYETSVSNLSRTSLERDMVFSDDNAVHQLPIITGDTKTGFTATLTVPV